MKTVTIVNAESIMIDQVDELLEHFSSAERNGDRTAQYLTDVLHSLSEEISALCDIAKKAELKLQIVLEKNKRLETALSNQNLCHGIERCPHR
jgi:hypothetical protein